MVSDQGIDVTNSPSLPNKNTGRNTTQTVTGSLKHKYYNEAGTNTGLNNFKATAQANKEYKASNQYKKDQKAKLKKTRSEAKENLKLGIDYSNLHKTHKKALEGTRIEKKENSKIKSPISSYGAYKFGTEGLSGYSKTKQKKNKSVERIYSQEGKKLGKIVRKEGKGSVYEYADGRKVTGDKYKVTQTRRNKKANKKAAAPNRSWGME
jgi:hypothetical protein